MSIVICKSVSGERIEIETDNCFPYIHNQRLVLPTRERIIIVGRGIHTNDCERLYFILDSDFGRVSSVENEGEFFNHAALLTSEKVFSDLKVALNLTFQRLNNEKDLDMLSSEQIDELRQRLDETDFLLKSALPQEVGEL
jgi:hypothetical protein